MSYASIFIISFMTSLSWGLALRPRLDRRILVCACGYGLLWAAINPDGMVSGLFGTVLPLPMLTLLFCLLGLVDLLRCMRKTRSFDRIFIALALGFMLITHIVFIGVYQTRLVPSWLDSQLSDRQWIFEANHSVRTDVCSNPDYECIEQNTFSPKQARQLHVADGGYSVWMEENNDGALLYKDKDSNFAIRDAYTSEIALETLINGYSMLSLAATIAWMLLGLSLIAFHRSKTREFP